VTKEDSSSYLEMWKLGAIRRFVPLCIRLLGRRLLDRYRFRNDWKFLLRSNPKLKGNFFTSGMLLINEPEVLRNWDYLLRGYREEDLIKSQVRKVSEHTMCSYDALATLSELTESVISRQTNGCLVEMGTWKGGASSLMAMTALKTHKELNSSLPKIHLFDSFMGLPRPSQVDFEEWMVKDWGISSKHFDGELKTTGALMASVDDARHAMFDIANYPKELVYFHQGWFQDTLPRSLQSGALSDILLLRLDADLYTSTYYCLENLYPLVVNNGIIIIDDYGLKGCRKAVHDFFATLPYKPVLHFVDAQVRYFLKTSK
jgi:O-methyltransferase